MLSNSLFKPHRLSALLLLVTASATSVRAQMEFDSYITLGASRTDNVDINEIDAQYDTVYRLRPGFTLTQAGTRINSDVAYRLYVYDYDTLDESNVYHELDADTQVALDQDNFFIDVGGGRTQSIRDPEEFIQSGNLAISSNRVDRDELYVGPNYQYAIGNSVAATGSYRRTKVRYDDELSAGDTTELISDYDINSLSIAFDNYQQGVGFSWAVRYDSEETDYGLVTPWEFRQATIELGGWVGPQMRVFAAGGKESAWDDPFDSSLEDSFYEAGVSFTPGDGLTAELAFGNRTFGSSSRVSLDLDRDRISMGLSYADTPSTDGNDPYHQSGLLDPGDPDDFLARPGMTERYISSRFQWEVGVDLRRTAVSLVVFDEDRTQRATADGTPLGDESQRGVTFSLSWEAGARTTFNVSGSEADREFATDNRGTYSFASMGASYELGSRTEISMDMTYSKDESDGIGTTRNYRARVLSIDLTRTF